MLPSSGSGGLLMHLSLGGICYRPSLWACVHAFLSSYVIIIVEFLNKSRIGLCVCLQATKAKKDMQNVLKACDAG